MAALTFSHLSSDTFEKECQKKAGRKRPRIRETVSCWQCRSRKIRCGREQPCRPCVERNAGAKCTYSQPKTASVSTIATSATDTMTDGQAMPIPKSKAFEGEPTTPKTPLLPGLSTLTKSRPAVATEIQSSNKPQSTSSPSSAGPVFKSHAFQGSNRKTRLVGVSHWMAPCNEMLVVKALVTRSKEFQTSLRGFAELKERLRLKNTVTVNTLVGATAANDKLSPSILFDALPDRQFCEEWIGRYFKGYGRIYNFLDPLTLAADVHKAFSSPDTRYSHATALNSVYILRVLVTVAVGMQLSDPHRLRGRHLGRLVEDFVQRAARVQKPCIGSVQVLLQLILLKTIAASDTDSEHDNMSLLGLSSHVVSGMGLHRDPALFNDVPPYYAEQRKRLWACFLRLHLAYCIRTGTQLNLRLEDSDCPLPAPDVLQPPLTETLPSSDSIRDCVEAWSLGENDTQNDAFFGYASAELSHIMAPIHQTLCSTKPRVSDEQQATLQSGFATLVSKLPLSLQPGTAITDPIIELQRTMLSVSMHSFLLIVSLSLIFGSANSSTTSATSAATPAEAHSQRPQLLEIWDYTVSILSQFQGICRQEEIEEPSTKPRIKIKAQVKPGSPQSEANNASTIAHHLMWTDAGRAALSGCLVVGRLHRQDLERIMPFSVHPQQQHTVAVFQQMLAQSLSVLLQLWRSKSHLGPVTAKTSLLLSVTVAVTVNLQSNFEGIFDSGVAAADRLIADIKNDLEQHQNEELDNANLHDTSVTRIGIDATQQLSAIASTAQPDSSSNLLGLTSSNTVPHTSSFSWNTTTLLDNTAPQMPELSASSSTASYTTTPDFAGAGNSGGSNSGDIFAMDFATDAGFLFGLPNNFDTGCPLDGDFDSTFMEFSGGTVMNMF